ncbi:hypothetical protein BDA99DRAFT_363228 [Phascolomyces articulosus]|uniref:Cryptic loci regulator 2 N-terminal domain-containing protein n=1 Tax=Phascolomyces articulosus TaxID=60185 RepID=A0AAD5KEY3_9FUNG|nr:hypothetical protein BDA99DRAFT_363228 [Phascolomyces articulosus]
MPKYISPPKRSDGKHGEELASKMKYEIFPFCYGDNFEGKYCYQILAKCLDRLGDVILSGLPKGYVLAGKRHPSGRVERYILGHPSGKIYRSAKGFIPHLKWLQSRNKNSICKCTLCPVNPHTIASQRTIKNSKRVLQEKRDLTQQRSSISMVNNIKMKKSLKREQDLLSGQQENTQAKRPEIKSNSKIRLMEYVYIESPPHPKDLPIPDYIDIPDLILPTNHCLN